MSLSSVVQRLTANRLVEAVYWTVRILTHGSGEESFRMQLANEEVPVAERKAVEAAVHSILSWIEGKEGMKVEKLPSKTREKYVEVLYSLSRRSTTSKVRQREVERALDSLRSVER